MSSPPLSLFFSHVKRTREREREEKKEKISIDPGNRDFSFKR